MAKNHHRKLKRRSSSHRPGSSPLRAFASHPFVEDLEARRLLAVVINEFGGGGTITNPAGITPGPDGNLWFTEANPSACGIGRITPSGAIEQFTFGLTSGSSPIGIAAGSDGALWFTEHDADQIGRIDTSGNITEFAIPTFNSQPEGSPSAPTAPSGSSRWAPTRSAGSTRSGTSPSSRPGSRRTPARPRSPRAPTAP